jgi:hypothetical protein
MTKRKTLDATAFRALALALPEAEEGGHHSHPDFRVRGKIFATLLPGETVGMVKLTPDEQQRYLLGFPGSFSAAPGAWGKMGCTYVELAAADEAVVAEALRLAWRSRAPKSLLERS